MKAIIFLAICAGIVLWSTFEVAVAFLSYQPVVIGIGLLLGGALVASGLLRGERFTRKAIRNVVPLIIAGLVSLIFVTLLRGSDRLAIVLAGGIACVGASVIVVVLEKTRHLLAAGVQAILLLYTWGLVPLWQMGVHDDWL